MRNLIDVKWAYGILFLYSLMVLINRLNVGVLWAVDTSEYIEKSVVRPPLYPLLMDVFKFIFGVHQFVALICFQLLFVLVMAFYLSRILWKKFDIHLITFVFLHLILSLPLLSISVAAGISGGIGNWLLTEAISYGLFLFAVSFLVKTLFGNERRNFFLFLMVIGILTWIRTPMIFLYGVAGAMILYLQLKIRNIRLTIGLVMAMVAVFLVTGLGERFYHKAVNNYWGRINRSASTMIIGAVYISDAQALNFIAEPRDREVLNRTYAYLENRKLLSKNRFEIDRRLVDIYNDYFCVMQTIILKSIQDVFFVPEEQSKPGWKDRVYEEFESFAQRVVPLLVIHHFKEFSRLMLLKFLYTLNFREGFFMALFLLFPFVRLSHPFKIMTFFVLLMLIMNRLMMTPIIAMTDRYLFYTDILEYVFIAIVADHYLRHFLGLFPQRHAGLT